MNIQAIIKSKWTTITGVIVVLATVLGGVTVAPHDASGWLTIVGGICVGLVGVFSKDAHQ